MKYLYSSLIEESIASSQIEGAATTREVAKDMIVSERPPRTHDEKMILNNFYAMQFISRNKKSPIDIDTILNLQQILTKGTLENSSDE
jgi:Fic family protein